MHVAIQIMHSQKQLPWSQFYVSSTNEASDSNCTLCLFIYHASTEMFTRCIVMLYHLVDFDTKGHFQSKRSSWLRLKKICMCLTCKTRWFWEVSDIDYPKFSARDQGVTYPKVGSSFLFQLQGGQTRIPSWWKRTWKMEGRIRKDQEPFPQYEVNHLYHWYGLLLSFLHLSNT